MIKKAVITAAGLGTRLLPATKEIPKEMLPVLIPIKDNFITLKPTLQIIFEDLYACGIREFYVIVGRGKRAIEDHFTPDYSFLDCLIERGKEDMAKELKAFYNKIEKSIIVWINQPEPKGFGDAVLRAKAMIKDEPFIVHAGDTLVFSRGKEHHVKRLVRLFTTEEVTVSLLLKEVNNPELYGVVVPNRVEKDVIKVARIIEKPKKPPSNLAVIPIYIFDSLIFNALEKVKHSEKGELELTSAIQKVIEWDFEVIGLILDRNYEWLDIGTPESYWRAIKCSRDFSMLKDKNS